MAEANLCRLCAVQKDSFVGIYEEEGHKLNLESKITKCLQIELYPKDALPKAVCLDCCTKLNQCSEFIETSAQAQVELHMIFLPTKKENVSLCDQELQKVPYTREENKFVPASTNVIAEQECTSSDEDPVTESNSPGYVECVLTDNVAGRSEEEEEDEDSSVVTLKRIKHVPIQWTLQLKPSDQKSQDSDKLVDSEDTVQLESVRRTIKAKMEAAMECTLETDKKNGEQQEEEQDRSYIVSESQDDTKTRKRREGWEKYPWMCTDCSQELPSMQALRTHHQTVHNQPPRFMCAQCSKVYTKYYGFVSHVRRHRNHMKFCCEECGKCFSNKKVLESHRATHSDARPFVCSECGKSFRQQSALYVHNRSHQPDSIKNRYPCDQCDKRFSTKPNLVTHKRIHTGIRNFTCDQCGKSFIQKGNLDAHLLTHSVDKPHVCPICDKGFKTPLQLRKHQTVHTGAKPHQCDVCGRQFRERGTLREHHRIHTGVMPFTCEFCGKSFRFKGILTTHRRQHTGERPYSCLECQHHFTNWPNYNKHMKRRHGINTSHQPDPNKIALANLASNGGILNTSIANQPSNILVMHQQSQVQQTQDPQQQEQQPTAIIGLTPSDHINHSISGTLQYNHQSGMASEHLHSHNGDRGPAVVTGTHFYNAAPAAHMNHYVGATVPTNMLSFYNLSPHLQSLEGTPGPIDIQSVQQR